VELWRRGLALGLPLSRALLRKRGMYLRCPSLVSRNELCTLMVQKLHRQQTPCCSCVTEVGVESCQTNVTCIHNGKLSPSGILLLSKKTRSGIHSSSSQQSDNTAVCRLSACLVRLSYNTRPVLSSLPCTYIAPRTKHYLTSSSHSCIRMPAPSSPFTEASSSSSSLRPFSYHSPICKVKQIG